MVELAGRLEVNPSFEAGHLQVPVQLFGEIDNDPRFLLATALPKELAGAIELEVEWLGQLSGAVGLSGSVEAESEWSALLGWPVEVEGFVELEDEWLAKLGSFAPELAGAVELEDLWTAQVLVPFRASGTVELADDWVASFGFPFPETGVVNLMRNPSVELSLLDWSGALTLEQGDAWAGESWAGWEIDAGGTGEIEIESTPGILSVGDTWVASVALDIPESTTVYPIVRILYTDDSVDETEPEEFDEYDDDGLLIDSVIEWPAWVGDGLGWRRFSLSLTADPAKTVDQVSLVLDVDNTAGAEPAAVRLDGAMIARFGLGHEVYVDGEQEGSAWLGEAHASASWREA